VKIPLDHICVKTGVLCPRCERLVSSGEIEKFEVNVMRLLLELEEKTEFKFLRNAIYHKAINVDNFLILIIELKEHITSRLLGRLGRALSDELKMRVRVVNKSNTNIREIASQLLYPARVIGVNTLWLPDGTVEHIVRIPRSDSRYLPSNIYALEQVLSVVTGMNVKIRTED